MPVEDRGQRDMLGARKQKRSRTRAEQYRLLCRLRWLQRLATDGELHDLSSWTLLIGIGPEARKLRLQLPDICPTPAPCHLSWSVMHATCNEGASGA